MNCKDERSQILSYILLNLVKNYNKRLADVIKQKGYTIENYKFLEYVRYEIFLFPGFPNNVCKLFIVLSKMCFFGGSRILSRCTVYILDKINCMFYIYLLFVCCIYRVGYSVHLFILLYLNTKYILFKY